MTSRATEIREAIYSRIGALGRYANMQRAAAPQRQPSDLPSCAVYIVSETLRPDGDANAGPPSFTADIVIGISVINGFDDPDSLAGKVDTDIDLIEMKLLADSTFVRFGPSALFEGVSQITRRRYYPPKDGETYFAELRLEMTFQSRVTFEPIVADNFEMLHITARPIQNPAAPPVEIQFDIPQN